MSFKSESCVVYLNRVFVVPTSGDVDFILEILDNIGSPLLDKIEKLMESAGKWDNVARNDFCRFGISCEP